MEVWNEAIKNTTVYFTSDEADLKKAKFHIVAVPTPVNTDHTPDLTPVNGVSEIVGRNLTKGSYVVFESTIRYFQYGDYRTREEAEAVMYKLKATRKFREISVRKTLINLPY